MGPVLNFDLQHEADALRGEVEYSRGGHSGRTLIKHSEFRVVLVALKASARVHQQQSDQRIAVQPLSGHLRLHLPSEIIEMHDKQLVSLDHDMLYSIEAVVDSTFLLWVGWSKE
jgi:hypothetical protein